MQAGALSLIFILTSVHCAGHFSIVRPGALISGPFVAVGPSGIRSAGATVQLAKPGGATGPYLHLTHDMPLAKRPRRLAFRG